DLPCPNDVWNQGKDDFIFLVLYVALGEEVFQDRNLCQPGNAVERPDVLIFQNTAQDVDFSFFKPNFVLDLALADDRLADASDIRLPGYRGNIHRDLQRDFAGSMHLGRDVDIHTDIQILKLCVDQRINSHTADSRLERSRSHRHPVADLEGGFLSI